MASSRVMLEVTESEGKLTLHAWLPPESAAACLAQVAAAWINRGRALECLCGRTRCTQSDLAVRPCCPRALGSGCCE